jgi:alpha-tubulin suppressor-like RCC1 family protein
MHTMILKTDGTLWATGYNFSGQLGTGDTLNRKTPVQVMSGVSAVSAGYFHTMILKSNGTLWATGNNVDGELGNGGMISIKTPVKVWPQQ